MNRLCAKNQKKVVSSITLDTEKDRSNQIKVQKRRGLPTDILRRPDFVQRISEIVGEW